MGLDLELEKRGLQLEAKLAMQNRYIPLRHNGNRKGLQLSKSTSCFASTIWSSTQMHISRIHTQTTSAEIIRFTQIIIRTSKESHK